MRVTSWFSDRTPDYHRLVINEEHDRNNSDLKWRHRFQAMTIVYALTMLCVIIAYCVESKGKAQPGWSLPTDVILGHIPTEKVLFMPYDSETIPGTAVSESENATLWDTLQPLGGGFIGVYNPRKYGLAGGFPLEKGSRPESLQEGYGISVFHQLHCLQAIRTGIHTRAFKSQHLDHCLDYLRQAIMCAGDTTLEKVRVDGNGVFEPEIDGWGAVHQCKNWQALFESAERQRVKVDGEQHSRHTHGRAGGLTGKGRQ